MSLDLPRLQRAQRRLADRPLQAVIDPLVGYCQRWKNPSEPLRAEARELLAACTGLSEPVIAWGLETSFGAWVGTSGDEASAIREMLAAELPRANALSGWMPALGGVRDERYVPVPVTLQILAGNIFAATIHQLLAGLIARTGQLIRPATGQRPFVELLLQSLGQVDPDLADTIQLVSFGTVDNDHEQAERAECYRAANVITVTGSDATVAAVRAEVPSLLEPGSGVVPAIYGFGHRVSAAYVARWCWEHAELRAAALEALAIDTCAYDQAGCLSPQIVFLEDATPRDLEAFAQDCLTALQAQTHSWPIGARSPADHATRRAFLDRVRMRGEGGFIHDDGEVAVVIELSDRPLPGPGMRTLVVSPVGYPGAVFERLEQLRGHLGSLGVALHPAVALKGWRQSSRLFPKPPSGAEFGPGFNRCCRLGEMQTPRIAEPHDGRPRVRLFLQREERPMLGTNN